MVQRGPITRGRVKRSKETLNELIQSTWSKIELEGQMTSIELKEQPLIHLFQIQQGSHYFING